MENAILSIRDLRVVFEDGFVALGGVSIDIGKNEFVTLLGPSGCGKTTLLRCIGGFEKPSAGEILYKGENIVPLPPYKRAINTVFQRYALFPHLNVAQNVAFGPDLRGEAKKRPPPRSRACWSWWAFPALSGARSPRSPAVSSSAWPSRAR